MDAVGGVRGVGGVRSVNGGEGVVGVEKVGSSVASVGGVGGVTGVVGVEGVVGVVGSTRDRGVDGVEDVGGVTGVGGVMIMKREIEDVLLVARLERPYYGRAIAALTPIESDQVPTFGVDKWWRLYWNPRYVAEIGVKAAGRIVAAHEVEHLLRHHHARLPIASRAAKIATDFEINDDVPSGYFPEGGLYPADFGLPIGLTAEEYLALLETEAACAGSDICAGGSGVVGTPEPWELPAPADGGPPGLDTDAEQRVREAVAADIRAHVAAHGRDSVPAHALIWADEVAPLPSPVDWRRELASLVSHTARQVSAGRDDYSWRRLRRRPSPILRPGVVRAAPRIAIVADTSGSMAGRGRAVISAVKAIVRTAGAATVVQCDAAVTNVVRTSHTPREWRGGGGTDMCVGIQCALSCRPRPDAIVVVTDAETPWPDVPPPVPVIVGLVGKANEIKVPNWAHVVEIQTTE